MPEFQPGVISQYNVGSLQNISTDISIKVLKEFIPEMPTVLHMSPCIHSLWISNEKVLQKVQPEVNNLKIISSFDIAHCGMAVTPTNDLLLTTSGPVLKMISGSTGEMIDSIYSVDPLLITSVHVTRDFKIIVGAKTPGEKFPAIGRRVVIFMDKEGKHTKKFEYDTDNQRLYTYPRSITTTQNGNIFVADQLSKDVSGRVMVSGIDGIIINIYNGHPDVNTEARSFKPKSIETTPSDKIIVPDKNSVLHILNNVGHLITYIQGGDVGIFKPYSFACTSLGKVYIGCTRILGSSDNSKLYEVELMGC